MREDQEFLQVAELYIGRPDFDVAKLVAGLVDNQSVPLLSVLRYKPSGLRKRAAWERTWDLQGLGGCDSKRGWNCPHRIPNTLPRRKRRR